MFVCVCERERERGTSNSGEAKKKCNGEKNFLSNFLSVFKIIIIINKRDKEITYLHLKIWRGRRKRNILTNKEGIRQVKGWGR